MNEMNIKKMNELLCNEDFSQKIAQAGSDKNAYHLFVENGMDATYEEFVSYLNSCHKEMMEKGLIASNGELSAEMLENVSGGGVGSFLLGCIAWFLIEKALEKAGW